MHLPLGRDPTGYRTDQFIRSAAIYYPEGEFEVWQQEFARRTAELSTDLETLPYPVLFGSNTDLYWSFEPRTSSDEPQTSLCELQKVTGGRAIRNKPRRRRYKKRRNLGTTRICVRFKGKGLSHLLGKTYCDRRQFATLHQWVSELEENKRRNKDDRFSLALLPLRSACLLWKRDEQYTGDEKPWQSHRLYLHCTIDTRLLTAGGTELVRQEKLALVNRYLKRSMENQVEEEPPCPSSLVDEEEEQDSLKGEDSTQIQKKNQTMRDRLLRNAPPPRPSKVPYRGDPNIVMKVAFSRQEIVGAAVVDLRSQQVLEYCTPRELLSEQRQEVLKQRSAKLHSQPKRQQKAQDKAEAVQQSEGKKSRSPYKPKINPKQLQLQPYRLINRWRRLRDQNIRDRQDEQQQGLYRPSKAEANLSQYLNRLIARRMIQRCQHWKVSTIVLPEFGDLRESVESEIKAKAKQKFCDDNVYRQQQYKKEHRMSFHRWSYKALSQCIRACANDVGIAVVTGRQPKLGTLREKAIAVSSNRLPQSESGDSTAA